MSGIRIAALRLGVVLTAGVVCGMPLLVDGKSSTDSGQQPQTAAVSEELLAAPSRENWEIREAAISLEVQGALRGRI